MDNLPPLKVPLEKVEELLLKNGDVQTYVVGLVKNVMTDSFTNEFIQRLNPPRLVSVNMKYLFHFTEHNIIKYSLICPFCTLLSLSYAHSRTSVSYKTGNFVPCIPDVSLLVVGLAMLGKSPLVSRQLRWTFLLASCGKMAAVIQTGKERRPVIYRAIEGVTSCRQG